MQYIEIDDLTLFWGTKWVDAEQTTYLEGACYRQRVLHQDYPASDKVGIEELVVEDGKAQDPSNKLEVVKMFWIHTWSRVNLQGVIIHRQVLK